MEFDDGRVTGFMRACAHVDLFAFDLGKTTAAKKMARLMRNKGLLPTDKCIEVSLIQSINSFHICTIDSS